MFRTESRLGKVRVSVLDHLFYGPVGKLAALYELVEARIVHLLLACALVFVAVDVGEDGHGTSTVGQASPTCSNARFYPKGAAGVCDIEQTLHGDSASFPWWYTLIV